VVLQLCLFLCPDQAHVVQYATDSLSYFLALAGLLMLLCKGFFDLFAILGS